MGGQAEELAGRLEAFNNELIAFVESCSEESWRKICASEDWPVGVTARHIGAAHYNAIEWAGSIVRGEKLPALTLEQVVEMANAHAREHAGCTKEEVVGLLREQGRRVSDYVKGLSDEELERTGLMPLIGKELSARKLLEVVILKSGGDHLASMKAAAGA